MFTILDYSSALEYSIIRRYTNIAYYYCALSTSTIDNISLFTNLLPECKHIATKSRRFSFDDEDFMQGEIDRLLSGRII